MPNTTRQGWEKIGIFICLGVQNLEEETLWAAERHSTKLEGVEDLVGGSV